MMRIAVGAVAALALAVAAAGCGDDSDDVKGRTGPNTQGVLLTVLSYGRATSAKEACPLLSEGYRASIGGGDATKCPTAGERTLCPCTGEQLETNSIVVEGDTATAKATRRSGETLDFTLVREGPNWKISEVSRGA